MGATTNNESSLTESPPQKQTAAETTGGTGDGYIYVS